MRVTIIGGGPGGCAAAFEAASRNMSATIIEASAIGGTCLTHGCIPAKTLRASADAMGMAKRLAEYGVTGCADPKIAPEVVQKRKYSIIDILAKGLQKTCASLGVNLIHGIGEIKSSREVIAHTPTGEERITGDAVIIATGSGIARLPGMPFDHNIILDSNDALALACVPERILILGGGVIGCELAYIFRAFGSEVTIVEARDRLLPIPSVDADISSLLARETRKQKIKIFVGATVGKMEIKAGHAVCELAPSPFVDADKVFNQNTVVEADKVFVTIGRAPVTKDLGLESLGIETNAAGWIKVNDRLETSHPGIYAVGDILGPSHIMLAHVAAMEAMTVINGLSGENGIMDYSVVPSAIFTEPEIGCVGLTESQAKQEFPHVECGICQMRELGKAQAMGELPGFFKIIANGENGKIVGTQIAGAHASDLIAETALAIKMGLGVRDLAATIHAHPTLAEGIFETARRLCQIMRANRRGS